MAIFAAVSITLPSVLNTPQLYQAQARIQYATALWSDLTVQTQITDALRAREDQIGQLLTLKYPDLGSRVSGLTWVRSGKDAITVIATARTGKEAQSLANDAAAGLARRMYTVVGDRVLQEVLSQYLWARVNDVPTQPEETGILRPMLNSGAFGAVAPNAMDRSLAHLAPDERFALTRSLEVLDELKGWDLYRAELSIQQTTVPQAQKKAQELQRGARAAQQAVRDFTLYMYRTYDTQYKPETNNPAYVRTRAITSIVLSNHTVLKVILAGLAGLLGGIVTVVIDRRVGIMPALTELWNYREMVRNFVSRDLKARYKNSLLGYFWSLINPLLTMLIFWAVFGLLLRNSIPQFPVFLIVALLPWNYAVTAVSGGMRAILDNAHLVKKVYFPRAILPIASVISNLVNYLLALPVMFFVMFMFQMITVGHMRVSWTFLYVPVLLVIQTIFLIGIALLLSSMAVFFRDTTHIVDIFIQLWIFITPVFFSLEGITRGNVDAARAVRWLNPMASLIDFYRDVLYGRAVTGEALPRPPSLPALDGVFRTLLTSLIILVIGAYVFQRTSRRFGEEL